MITTSVNHTCRATITFWSTNFRLIKSFCTLCAFSCASRWKTSCITTFTLTRRTRLFIELSCRNTITWSLSCCYLLFSRNTTLLMTFTFFMLLMTRSSFYTSWLFIIGLLCSFIAKCLFSINIIRSLMSTFSIISTTTSFIWYKISFFWFFTIGLFGIFILLPFRTFLFRYTIIRILTTSSTFLIAWTFFSYKTSRFYF